MRRPLPHPIWIVLHQEHSRPGRIGHALQQLGYPLDVRRPRFGEPLPSTMAEHAGAVIFGGPMSANDSDDFIRREIEWPPGALDRQREGEGWSIVIGGRGLGRWRHSPRRRAAARNKR